MGDYDSFRSKRKSLSTTSLQSLGSIGSTKSLSNVTSNSRNIQKRQPYKQLRISLPNEPSTNSLSSLNEEDLQYQLYFVLYSATLQWEYAIPLFYDILSSNMNINYHLKPRNTSVSYTLQYHNNWYEVSLSCILPLTPLQYAAYLGCSFAILPLIEKKANIHLLVQNQNYEFGLKTASDISLQRGYHDIYILLQEYDNYLKIDDLDTKNHFHENMQSNQLNTIPRPSLYRIHSNEIFLNDSNDILSSNIMNTSLNHFNNENTGISKIKFGSETHAAYKTPTEDRMVTYPLSIRSEFEEKIIHLTLFCILDGHGGSHYANDISEILPVRIKSTLIALYSNKYEITNDMIIFAIKSVIQKLDAELVELGKEILLYQKGGSTLVITLVTDIDIIVFNIGDSPAITFKSSKVNKIDFNDFPENFSISDICNCEIIDMTDDHCPENPLEYERINSLGAKIVSSNEFGDMRVQSGRGQLTVTRAMGQYEFKKDNLDDISKHVVTAEPQVYIWPRYEYDMNGIRSNRFDFLTLYSDSFTEALRDHRSGKILSQTGRCEQVIGNFLTNQEALLFIDYELRKNNYDVITTSSKVVLKQVNKFFMYDNFFGDNTTIILVDLRDNNEISLPVKDNTSVMEY